MNVEQALTKHAAACMSQRAVSKEAIELLLRFGSSARVRGADTFFFDKSAREQLAEAMDFRTQRRAEKFLNVYAIVSDDGRIITMARRTRRLRRH